MGEEDAVAAAINLQRGRRSNIIKPTDTLSVCDLATMDVNRDARSGDGSRGIPFAGGHGSVSGAVGASGGTV